MNRHRIVAKLIGWSVPFLNLFRRPEPWPYDLDELQNLEEGTLGKELHRFLHSRNLGYLPKYEVHDTYHALLGYGTTVTEELKLQSFMWGNKNSTFAGKVLFILGFIVFPSKRDIMRAEIKRGKSAKKLSGIDVVSIIPVQLVKLRTDLCIN
ncbi:Coq4 family protein [Arsukibacterium ikkense]|uniref:Coq4 family protein n=1 Tax=Arsukibacterium ikkense TaxID=336831 RepID=UPI0006994135|nr:Coq4 family protein [Arsukibacterium ikkense]